jgi:hypothetical protein
MTLSSKEKDQDAKRIQIRITMQCTISQESTLLYQMNYHQKTLDFGTVR